MELKLGSTYIVEIAKITSQGVAVYVNGVTTTTGFIHISKISSEFVANIENFVTVGEVFQAECIEGKLGKPELSILNQKLTLKQPSQVSSIPKIVDPLDAMISELNKVFEDKKHVLRDRENRKAIRN